MSEFTEEQARIRDEVDAELGEWPTRDDPDAATWTADGSHEEDPRPWWRPSGQGLMEQAGPALSWARAVYGPGGSVRMLRLMEEVDPRLPTEDEVRVIMEGRRALQRAILPPELLGGWLAGRPVSAHFEMVAMHPRAPDGFIAGLPVVRGPLGVGLRWRGDDGA